MTFLWCNNNIKLPGKKMIFASWYRAVPSYQEAKICRIKNPTVLVAWINNYMPSAYFDEDSQNPVFIVKYIVAMVKRAGAMHFR